LFLFIADFLLSLQNSVYILLKMLKLKTKYHFASNRRENYRSQRGGEVTLLETTRAQAGFYTEGGEGFKMETVMTSF